MKHCRLEHRLIHEHGAAGNLLRKLRRLPAVAVTLVHFSPVLPGSKAILQNKEQFARSVLPVLHIL